VRWFVHIFLSFFRWCRRLSKSLQTRTRWAMKAKRFIWLLLSHMSSPFLLSVSSHLPAYPSHQSHLTPSHLFSPWLIFRIITSISSSPEIYDLTSSHLSSSLLLSSHLLLISHPRIMVASLLNSVYLLIPSHRIIR